jgi:3-hydroxyisobutyrate dehydrogenase-like beta-hydroxyacid dehydrogenase
LAIWRRISLGLAQLANDKLPGPEMVFTSLPVPADVERVALGPNGLIEGMRPDNAFFDMSTNSVAMVRKINAAFAEKNLYMLDSPVSGGLGCRQRQVHNCTSAVMGVALAEVFTMGIKAVVEPLELWEAVRQGRPAGSAPSTGSAGFCRASTTLPISHCGCCTRMSGSRSGSGVRSGCRCDSPTWPTRN